jgi:predicted outer membrane repeat protein
MLAVVLAVVVTGAGGAASQASAATARVPCRPAALSAAISSAPAGATVSLMSACEYVLAAGLPAVTQDLTIAGNGATLKRSSAPGTPVFTILPVTGGNLTVGDLNFRNGGGSPSLSGGAISDSGDGQLTIHGGNFTGNTAGGGGAISSFPPDDQVAPVISGAVFTRNSALGGGAISSSGISDRIGGGGPSIVVSNCAFRDNHAGYGGAVWEEGSGAGGFSSTVFTGNTATWDGGALWLSEVFEPSLSQDTFRSNTAGGNGGAVDAAAAPRVVYSNDEGGVNISGSLVAWNHADGNGGGIYDGPATTSDLDNVTIKGNTATDGGGIFDDTLSELTLSGAALTRNTATGDGGGLDNARDESTAGLTGTTVTGNRAAAGGGIYGANTTLGPGSSVTRNKPDNCEPTGSVPGCTG